MMGMGERALANGIERRSPAPGPARADRIALFILLASAVAAAGAVAFIVFLR